MICIAAALGLGATILSRRLRTAGWADHRRLAALVATVAVVMLTVYAVLLPAPDDVPVPANLVWRFRVASLGANLSLWTVLTLGVCWLVAESRHDRGATDAAKPVARPSAVVS